MTAEKFYETLGGNYADVLQRLRKPDFIKKLIMLYPSDTAFDELTEALKKNDVQTAFRGAHTIKGVTSNLGFTTLHKSACDLTEYLRAGGGDDAGKLYEKVKTDRDEVLNAIKELEM